MALVPNVQTTVILLLKFKIQIAFVFFFFQLVSWHSDYLSADDKALQCNGAE